MSNKTRIMSVTTFCVLLFLSFACENKGPQEESKTPQKQDGPDSQASDVPQEAAPVISLLKAIKASDINGFRKAYSRRIREDTEQGDWVNNLKEAQANIRKMYGDYELNEFEFEFEFNGDREKGKVSISHKGKKSIALEIINEGGLWKIDTR